MEIWEQIVLCDGDSLPVISDHITIPISKAANVAAQSLH